MKNEPTLGTLLRTLVEHLDGAVEKAYADGGLDYKPRYTPVVRTLVSLGPSTLRTIADHVGSSHSAVSQTVSQMVERGLLEAQHGVDARERIISLTAKASALLPHLERQWSATEAAARTLDSDLGFSLPEAVQRTLEILSRKSFADRIADAAIQIDSVSPAGRC